MWSKGVFKKLPNKIFCKLLLSYRRIAFKDYEGRREAAKKVTEESKKIEKLFKKLAKATLESEKQCSVLPTLAEVIKLRDTSMMALEISVSCMGIVQCRLQE